MIRAKRKKETEAERQCRNYPCVGQPLLNEGQREIQPPLGALDFPGQQIQTYLSL